MVNLKNLALGIGIIVVFALLLWQGIEAFYPSPNWEDYCGDKEIPGKIIEDKNSCEINGGRWTPQEIRCVTEPCPQGYCDLYYQCNLDLQEDQESHSQVVFIISLIAAVVVIIVGYSFLKTEPVGSALIGSGVWAIFWGSAINWRNFSNIWRFLLLLIAFIAIVWITHRLNSKKKKSFWK